MGMGEETTSQVQDVVVAGSQSSNFLLPKENSGKASRSPGTHNGGPMCWGARGGQTKPGEVTALDAGPAREPFHTRPRQGLSLTVPLTPADHSCSKPILHYFLCIP